MQKVQSDMLQAQRSAGYVLSHSATRSAMAAYQKGKDSKSVMELFERAVENEMADTDIYCDAMGSCIDSRRYKVSVPALHPFCMLFTHAWRRYS